jgi:hypothetical protein
MQIRDKIEKKPFVLEHFTQGMQPALKTDFGTPPKARDLRQDSAS